VNTCEWCGKSHSLVMPYHFTTFTGGSVHALLCIPLHSLGLFCYDFAKETLQQIDRDDQAARLSLSR
jgi:hypothetical protein